MDEISHQLSTLRSHCNHIRNELKKLKDLKKNGQQSISEGSHIIAIDGKRKELAASHNNYAKQFIELNERKKELQHNIQQSSSPNYTQLLMNNLKRCRICDNLYFDALEGNAAKRFRQNYSNIIAFLYPSKFAMVMSEIIKLYNSFMALIGSAKSYINEEKIEEAEKLLKQFDKQWKYSSNILGINSSLGAKYHYLEHAVQYSKIWRFPIGYVSEQSIEGYHKTCSKVFSLYKTQRGIDRIRLAIQRLMFVTSPLYRL